jgi:hypothetical protein
MIDEQRYFRIGEGPFYKDVYLIKLIIMFHNMYIISGVLVYALCFYDSNHLMWQIQYGLDNLNLNNGDFNNNLKQYIS